MFEGDSVTLLMYITYGNLIFLVVYFEVLSITSCVWNSRYFEAMVWLQQCGMVCVFIKHNLGWLKLARNFLGDRRHILHLFFFFTFEYWWISRMWVEEEKLPVKISAGRHAGFSSGDPRQTSKHPVVKTGVPLTPSSDSLQPPSTNQVWSLIQFSSVSF